MNIFKLLDYKEIIRQRVKERRKAGLKVTYEKLAEKCRIPKSYLSKVMTGGAELSQDQLFSICKELNFSEEEHHYIALLLEKDRSGLSDRKSKLNMEIKQIQRTQLDTKTHLKAQVSTGGIEQLATYYLNPSLQLVHSGLSINEYRSDLPKFSKKLGISPEKLSDLIAQLEKMGLISITNGKITVPAISLHLPKDSPIYAPWRNLVRLSSLKRLDSAPEASTYSFSVTMSCNESTRTELQRRFLEYIKNAQELVGEAKEENVYQLNFDLFPWL